MDILFISSIELLLSNIKPQIGLYSLQNVLKDKYHVKVINFDYLNYIGEFLYLECIEENIENITKYILKFNPKVLGFYAISSSYAISLMVAKRVRLRQPSIKIIFGGPQATLTAKESLEVFPFIDAIALGEAELYIGSLIDSLINNKDLSSFQGIAVRNSSDICINYFKDKISNNDLGNYTVYDFEDIDFDLMENIPIDAGRGCPFGCTFCSTSIFWGRSFRIKPVQQLIHEMNTYHKLFNKNYFTFNHDMFTADKKYLDEFCQSMIQNNLSFLWSCSSRVDALNNQTILKMKEANCDHIYIGIETGSQSMQRKIGKHLKLDQVRQTLLILKDSGISATISFIYGFPDETVEEFRDTLKLIEYIFQLGIRRVQLHLFMPLPQTTEVRKVIDRLYFDPETADVSIFNSRYVNQEIRSMIESNKAIFSQIYTFSSEVRDLYHKIDILVFMFGVAGAIYKFILAQLLRDYGLERIYYIFKDEIIECYRNIYINNDINIQQNEDFLVCAYMALANSVIKKFEMDKKFPEIYQFESHIYDHHISPESSSAIYKYDIDVVAIREGGTDKQGAILVKIYKDSAKKIRFDKLYVKIV